MLKKILLLALFLIPTVADAAGQRRTTDEILQSLGETVDTSCSTKIFADALAESAEANINEDDSEELIREWVYTVFQDPVVLTDVLSCPEVENADEDDTINFRGIKYKFKNGREISVNYQTQPKVLEQHMMLAFKTETPTDDPNPQVSPYDTSATWVNVDPAWYAIMVTQAGALDKFVGKDKNNTVSFKYIEDHIDELYPRGYYCTAKSALSTNDMMVNKVMRKKTTAVNGEETDVDYYIAGDVSLQYISYAEVAAEVILTVVSSVATYGAGAVVQGITKGLRAKKIMKAAKANIKLISKVGKVPDYIKLASKVYKGEKDINHMNDLRKSIKNIEKIERKLASAPKGSKRYERLTKQLENTTKSKDKAVKELRKTYGSKVDNIKTSDNLDTLTDWEKQANETIAETQKSMNKMAKGDKDIAEYNKQVETLRDMRKYSKDLRAIKQQPKTGNVFHRGWQALKGVRTSVKAANKSAASLNKAARAVRRGSPAGKAKDWLFHATMRDAGRIGNVVEKTGAAYLALSFLGDMYDFTNDSTGDYTNNIEMKPLLLLSADETSDGSESNIVNYGVWLMWAGDSVSQADDDAAYLQAMDFAQKFYQDLVETQTEEGEKVCDVDIYVVRPIIRNPGTDHAALYWLVMNEKPWSTSPR